MIFQEVFIPTHCAAESQPTYVPELDNTKDAVVDDTITNLQTTILTIEQGNICWLQVRRDGSPPHELSQFTAPF